MACDFHGNGNSTSSENPRWQGGSRGERRRADFGVYAPSPLPLSPLQSINAWTGFTFAVLKCCTLADSPGRGAEKPRYSRGYHVANSFIGEANNELIGMIVAGESSNR